MKAEKKEKKEKLEKKKKEIAELLFPAPVYSIEQLISLTKEVIEEKKKNCGFIRAQKITGKPIDLEEEY